MVFPSLSFSVDPGIISSMSTFVVIGFSFMLRYWKKTLFTISIVLGVALFSLKASAIGLYTGSCGTMCSNNQNYYGSPWGQPRPVYYYPQLQYHSFWGPTPYYFNSHGASPYAPSWYNNCPHCSQHGTGFNNWNTIMPNQSHGPGMPAS